jgi:hypothetical protein
MKIDVFSRTERAWAWPMSIDKARRLGGKILWGMIVLDLMFVSMAVIFLVESHTHYEDGLKTSAHNLVRLLEERIADRARLIADAVARIDRELDRQMASGSIDAVRLEQLLDSELARLPEIDAIRVTNAAGDVRWGKGVGPGATCSYMDDTIIADSLWRGEKG